LFALLAVAETSLGAVGGCVSTVAVTVIVALAVLTPTLFEAVNRYVVVRSGDTVIVFIFVTFPTPLSMLRSVAPETLQDKVTGWAGVVLDGTAENEEITGAWGPGDVFFHVT
jgi:hypothetical protein